MTGYLYVPIGQRRGSTGTGTRPRLKHVIHAIRTLTESQGTPPTIRELARHLGVVPTRVQQIIHQGRRAGLLTDEPFKARTLRALDTARTVDNLRESGGRTRKG